MLYAAPFIAACPLLCALEMDNAWLCEGGQPSFTRDAIPSYSPTSLQVDSIPPWYIPPIFAVCSVPPTSSSAVCTYPPNIFRSANAHAAHVSKSLCPSPAKAVKMTGSYSEVIESRWLGELSTEHAAAITGLPLSPNAAYPCSSPDSSDTVKLLRRGSVVGARVAEGTATF